MKSNVASSNLGDLPALKVLMKARAQGRLPHAILLTGADPELLERAATYLAEMHLELSNPLAQADCFLLRPVKVSRQIGIEATLEVVSALHLTSLSPRRVVVVQEPDRFTTEAANSFLKTLEEPPANSLIILYTTHYYRVMPTILSRCLRFHLGGDVPVMAHDLWSAWLRDFDQWLKSIATATTPRVSEVFMPIYGLCARFEGLLESLVEDALEKNPAPEVEDRKEAEELELAHEAAMRRGIRQRMLGTMQERLRLLGRQYPESGQAIAQAIQALEISHARLELNYQEVAALEQFFLQTSRAFSRRLRS